MGAWALRRTLWKYHKRSDSPVKNSKFIAFMRSTNKGNYYALLPLSSQPGIPQPQPDLSFSRWFTGGAKKNLSKSEGENPGLILLLILAVDRQGLVRRLNDFHGRFAIYIEPKSMSRKQIKATVSCSSVAFGGEAAGEMESGAWKPEEAGVVPSVRPKCLGSA